jgi:aspartyl-tRNA(Asn)/glutamyl-tRNA(Gln) amidotransferase subunit A
MTLWSAGAALALKPFTAEERARMDPGLVAVAGQGERQSASAYVDALLFARNRLSQVMSTFHQRYDLLLTPTLPLPAFAVGHDTPPGGPYGEDWVNWTPYTYPFNITQQPAASIPSGLTRSGRPAGLQIVGAFGSDALVLRAARAYEAARSFPALERPRP